MTNLIPIFPLQIVVYPNENLNLHIFEPRYKQLIYDCYAANKPFGIVPVLQNNITEVGTLLTITEIVQVYEDGKMDIKTQGIEVFKILEIINQLPEKLYSAAIVTYPNNNTNNNLHQIQQLVTAVSELHKLLEINKDFKNTIHELLSYDFAHHVGLSIHEEYELLQLLFEEQIIEFLKKHVQKVLSVVTGIESLKERIHLNGHFKQLKGFNL